MVLEVGPPWKRPVRIRRDDGESKSSVVVLCGALLYLVAWRGVVEGWWGGEGEGREREGGGRGRWGEVVMGVAEQVEMFPLWILLEMWGGARMSLGLR